MVINRGLKLKRLCIGKRCQLATEVKMKNHERGGEHECMHGVITYMRGYLSWTMSKKNYKGEIGWVQ